MPQGSLLGALHVHKKASLHNYADDNTLSTYSLDLNSLIDILIEESQTINWLKTNHMIVNPKKFQAMLVSKRKNIIPEDLTICISDIDIKLKNSVKLLGITLDNKLNFGCQLNVPFRLKKVYLLQFQLLSSGMAFL